MLMTASAIKTFQNSPIMIATPGGRVDVGRLIGNVTTTSADIGVVTTAGGAISMLARDNVDVNQSRIFTVAGGDLLLWSSLGNIDAGRGAKTVTGAPPPIYTFKEGRIVVDTSASFSGSGIAALDAGSALDLFAPRGEINAGDAGIKSAGSLNIGAVRVEGGDNIAAGGLAVGVPVAASGSPAAGLGGLGQSATNAGNQKKNDALSSKKKWGKVLVDLLGFGEKTQPIKASCRQGVTENSDCSGLPAGPNGS